MRRSGVGVAVAAAALLCAPGPGVAHEIPQSVTILAYIRPEANVIRLVARVPLEAMRDVQWPLRGPGYLVLDDLDPLLRDGTKIWVADNIHMYEDGRAIGPAAIRYARVSLQSDRSFESYDAAVAHFGAPPLAATTDLPWQQAMVDVVLEYPISTPASRFSIEPKLARLGVHTNTILHFLPQAGPERTYAYFGDPGLVHLDPQWFQAAGQFIALGFRHILDGIDHLLFIICLVIPFRRVRPLIVIATSFTIAHSITMVVAALGYAPSALWFPPLVEVLIAASIVYTAIENIVGARLERRWMIAFAFGLVHGFGFSFALRDALQFAGRHLAVSLATFNIGVELGQVFVLLLAVPVLNWVFSRVVAERMGTIIASAIVAHTAWHWMLDRWGALREFPISRPALDAAFAAAIVRLALVLVAGAGVVWAGRPLVSRLLRGGAAPAGRGQPDTGSARAS